MTATHTTQLRALRITPEQIEHTIIDHGRTLDALHESIGCDNFDVVGLEDDIDLFVDDEGAINGSPPNLRVTIMAHSLVTPAVLFGNTVVLDGSLC